MKKFLTILTLTALGAIPATTLAAPKKEAAPAAPAAPAAVKAAVTKPIPMYSEVSAIDVKAKTFSHNNKDGTVVKFNVTDATEIKNGEADAKFGDIKVGDYVSGLRTKKSATEYDVVKITKFGPKPEKKATVPADAPAVKKAS